MCSRSSPGRSSDQAPHVDVAIFARGLLHQVLTRIYFPDEAERNAADPVLSSLDADARATLVAQPSDDGYALRHPPARTACHRLLRVLRTASASAARCSATSTSTARSAAPRAFTRPFQEYITGAAWGDVWGRPGLDRRTRSAVTLGILTALRAENELPMHVRAARRNGLTKEEISEVLLHAAVYAGVPAANAAFAIAQRTLDERAR